MGKSNSRTAYFERYIKPLDSPEAYVEALKKSPYRQHQRAGAALEMELKKMIEARDAQVRKQELDAFAKALGL